MENTEVPERDIAWFSSDHLIDSLLTLHNLVCTEEQRWSPQYTADLHDGIQALKDRLKKSVNDPMIEPRVKDAVKAAISDCQKVAVKLQPVAQKVSGAPASAHAPSNESRQAGR